VHVVLIQLLVFGLPVGRIARSFGLPIALQADYF
jgi:hypothetical protein